MLSITIQSFSCSLDVEVFGGTTEEMMSVRWQGCRWERWWTDDEECSISNSWNNNIALRKQQKCLDEGVHLVTENSQTYIVHQFDVTLGITSLLFITQIHNVPSTCSMDNINASIKCSQSIVVITGNPWHTYNSRQQTNIFVMIHIISIFWRSSS